MLIKAVRLSAVVNRTFYLRKVRYIENLLGFTIELLEYLKRNEIVLVKSLYRGFREFKYFFKFQIVNMDTNHS